MGRKCKIKMLYQEVYALTSHTFAFQFPNDQTLPPTTVVRLWLILPVYLTAVGMPLSSAVNKTTISSLLWKTRWAMITTVPNRIRFLHFLSKCTHSSADFQDTPFMKWSIIQTLLRLILLDFFFSSLFCHFYKKLTASVWRE